MIVPAINAQKSNTAKALKELAKAQENLNKKNDASAWLKYGTALLYAYEAPVDGLSTGMDANNVAIMTKGHIRLSSEQTEINGKQYVVNKYFPHTRSSSLLSRVKMLWQRALRPSRRQRKWELL